MINNARPLAHSSYTAGLWLERGREEQKQIGNIMGCGSVFAQMALLLCPFSRAFITPRCLCHIGWNSNSRQTGWWCLLLGATVACLALYCGRSERRPFCSWVIFCVPERWDQLVERYQFSVVRPWVWDSYEDHCSQEEEGPTLGGQVMLLGGEEPWRMRRPWRAPSMQPASWAPTLR